MTRIELMQKIISAKLTKQELKQVIAKAKKLLKK